LPPDRKKDHYAQLLPGFYRTALFCGVQLDPNHKIFFVNVGEERDAGKVLSIKMIATQNLKKC